MATDGSGTKFIADTTFYLSSALVDGENDRGIFHLSGYLNLPDGSVYRIDNGNVTWTQDRNGNITFVNYSNGSFTSVKDSLDRQIQLSSSSGTSYLSYLGTGGTPRSMTIRYCSISDPCLRNGQSLQYLNSLFPWLGAVSQLLCCGRYKKKLNCQMGRSTGSSITVMRS